MMIWRKESTSKPTHAPASKCSIPILVDTCQSAEVAQRSEWRALRHEFRDDEPHHIAPARPSPTASQTFSPQTNLGRTHGTDSDEVPLSLSLSATSSSRQRWLGACQVDFQTILSESESERRAKLSNDGTRELTSVVAVAMASASGASMAVASSVMPPHDRGRRRK